MIDRTVKVLCPSCGIRHQLDPWAPQVQGAPKAPICYNCGTELPCPKVTLSESVTAEITAAAEDIDRVTHGEIVIKIQDGRSVLVQILSNRKPTNQPATPRRLERK